MSSKIAICSMFRDSVFWHGKFINQAQRYFRQIEANETTFSKLNSCTQLSYYWIEGNSNDTTRDELHSYKDDNPDKNITILSDNSNTLAVESTGKAERIAELSKLGNQLLTKAVEHDNDYVIWMESDLIIGDDLFLQLLDSLYNKPFFVPMIIAPVVMLGDRDIFYDTWGFINADGTHWRNTPAPFHCKEHLQEANLKYINMKSIGSCAIIPTSLVRQGVTFGTGAFQELCSGALAKGYNIVVDVGLRIKHPGEYFINNRWV